MEEMDSKNKKLKKQTDEEDIFRNLTMVTHKMGREKTITKNEGYSEKTEKGFDEMK